MTEEIDERVARCHEQPSLGILRDAVSRPSSQRLEQSVAKRIFGACQVLCMHGKIGDQATV